ncbi:MAG: IS5 family transposase [Acetobacteraceae bacterium]|nr:IS5 family transposase [Acetobacteraceae bacterium]
MLTDEQWAMLEPLVEACRPPAKVPPKHLRRTLSAILWRHDNGAEWCAIPEELGPWWMAAQMFIRWSRLGVWERMLAMAQERGVALGMAFPLWYLHPCPPEGGRGGQKGATPPERDAREALGRSRGGYGTKAAVIAEGAGRAVAFKLAPGQAHELPHAVPLLEHLSDVPLWVVADRGLSRHAFREHIWDTGARPAVPPKVNEALVAGPPWIYNNRERKDLAPRPESS